MKQQRERSNLLEIQKGFGIIVGAHHDRGFEVLIIRCLSSLIQEIGEIGWRPKVLILTNNTKRVEMITQELQEWIDASGAPFIIRKTKKGISLNSQDQWEQEIQQNDIFLFYYKTFYLHVQHGDILLKKKFFDFIFFDDITETSQDGHQYILLVYKFMYEEFNMLKQKLGDLLRFQMIAPFLICYFNIEKLKNLNDDLKSTIFQIQTYANIFNAPLLITFKPSEIQEIQDILYLKLQNIRYPQTQNYYDQMFREANILLQHYRNLFMEGQCVNIVPAPNICDLKQLPDYMRYYVYSEQNKAYTAKILAKDAEQVIQGLCIASMQVINYLINNRKNAEILSQKGITTEALKSYAGNPNYKMSIETTQYMRETYGQGKFRFYSSRIKLDALLSCLLSFNTSSFSSASNFASSNTIFKADVKMPCRIIAGNSQLRLFKKKTESEFYVFKEFVKVMHQQGLLDNNLRPSQPAQVQLFSALCGKEAAKIQEVLTSEGQKSKHKQEALPEIKIKIKEEKKKEECEEQIFPHIIKLRNLEERIEAQVPKLTLLEVNKERLLIFITDILNPIIKGISLYQKQRVFDYQKEKQQSGNDIRKSQFGFSWRNKYNNVNIETENSMNINSDQAQINSLAKQFQEYSEKIFPSENIEIESEHFNDLLNIIDNSVYEQGFIDIPVFLKYSGWSVKKMILVMLCIALTNLKPTTVKYARIKDEMDRLAFFGDSSLNLSVILNMLFSGQRGYTEKELSSRRIETIKEMNLRQHGESFQLFQISVCFEESESNFSGSSEYKGKKDDHYDPCEHLQRLVGFISLYLGFDAAYLFIMHLKVIKPYPLNSHPFTQDDDPKAIFYAAQLWQLSENRRKFIEEQKTEKGKITEEILNVAANQNMNHSRDTSSKEKEGIIWMEEGKKDDGGDQRRDYRENFQTIKHMLEFKTVSNQVKSLAQKGELLSQVEKQGFSANTLKEFLNKDETLQQILTIQSAQKILMGKEQPQDCSETNKKIIEDKETVQNDDNYKSLTNLEQSSFPPTSQDIMYSCENDFLFLECMTHQSFSTKMINDYMKENGSLEIKQLASFNYEILEYLGDSILNFTLAKRFYYETAIFNKKWHLNFFQSNKLHDLKTYFSSNSYIAFILYEQFYNSFDKKQLSLYNEKFKLTGEPIYVPFLFDETNNGHAKQIKKYTETMFKLCSKQFQKEKKISDKSYELTQSTIDITNDDVQDLNQEIELLNKIAQGTALNLSSLNVQDETSEDETMIEFEAVKEKLVKFFSDVFEGLIGALFVDSADFDITQLACLRMLNSRFIQSIPIIEHNRTKVLNCWNSKIYCKTLKMYHTTSEKDGYTYFIGFIQSKEVRKRKFKPEDKQKLHKFYDDFRYYLENAYLKFEIECLYINDAKRWTQKELTLKWQEFNDIYRKLYIKLMAKEKESSKPKHRYLLLTEQMCILLNKNDEGLSSGNGQDCMHGATSEVDKIDLAFKTYKSEYMDKILQDKKHAFSEKERMIVAQNPRFELVLIENDRIKRSAIREIFTKCEIKAVEVFRESNKSFRDFLNNMSSRQQKNLYYELNLYGNKLKTLNQSQQSQISKSHASQSSTSKSHSEISNYMNIQSAVY